MKKNMLLSALFFIPALMMACPECERKQAAALKGIAHGAGPEQQWDYVIVILTAIIVVVSLFYAVKWLINPGERQDSHIKREVLNFD